MCVYRYAHTYMHRHKKKSHINEQLDEFTLAELILVTSTYMETEYYGQPGSQVIPLPQG